MINYHNLIYELWYRFNTMIGPGSASVTGPVLFNLRNLLGNSRLNFAKYKNFLIHYSVYTAQNHKDRGVAGHIWLDAPRFALSAGVPTLRPVNIWHILLAGANAAAQAFYKSELSLNLVNNYTLEKNNTTRFFSNSQQSEKPLFIICRNKSSRI